MFLSCRFAGNNGLKTIRVATKGLICFEIEFDLGDYLHFPPPVMGGGVLLVGEWNVPRSKETERTKFTAFGFDH